MEKSSTIVVTGAAGFIGSYLVGFLNKKGYNNLLLVDEFSRADKERNLDEKRYDRKIDRAEFLEQISHSDLNINYIFHLGARTDTTEFDYSIHQQLNVEYSQKIWQFCAMNSIPLVYASSAATYGSGEFGYDDDHQVVENLQPLNPYGRSKNEFDKWALKQIASPPFWAGLKFFNVYGPNEYHKGRMASVIFHSFNQIQEKGFVKLFKSHKEGYIDGEQLRDFVYVKDVADVCLWLMENTPASGLYNLGTGVARSFHDLVLATFKGLKKEAKIEYIDMPLDIRETYQYFTQANMSKLKASGYSGKFHTLEDGIVDYVRNYLAADKYY